MPGRRLLLLLLLQHFLLISTAIIPRRELLGWFSAGGVASVALPPAAPVNAAPQPPLVGRFEPLKGALSFIGSWDYAGTVGPPKGELRFLRDGDVELVKDGAVLAVSAAPWKYESAKSALETSVALSFTIDASGLAEGEGGYDDVLILSGTVETVAAEPGQARAMTGVIEVGRAEVGARGGGPRKKVGEFTARGFDNTGD